MLTREEFNTLKFYEIPNRIYNRIRDKWAQILGVHAEEVLQKYYEKPFHEIADCSVIDIWDCFTIL